MATYLVGDGSFFPALSGDDLIHHFVFDGSNVTYHGRALPGTATSVAQWQIMKLTYDGSNVTDITFAEGSNKYEYEMDAYASYTYS